MTLTFQTLGRRAVAIIADVSREEDVQGMVAQTVASLGDLNVSCGHGLTVLEVQELIAASGHGRQCRNHTA